MNRRPRRSISVWWLALMSGAVTLQLGAQTLNRVPSAQLEKVIASLDKHLLPEGAKSLEVERDQVVAAPGVTFLPVRFEAEDKNATLVVPGEPSRTKFYCGLYQIKEGVSAKFILTFGAGQTEAEECTGLKAIGAAAPHATHGNLILIYNASTLREELPEPVILSWQDSPKKYVVNDELTSYVGTNSRKSYTIFNIRSVLQSRAAQR